MVLFWGGFGGCPFPLFTHYIWPIFCISYTVLGKLLIVLTPLWACPKFDTLPPKGPRGAELGLRTWREDGPPRRGCGQLRASRGRPAPPVGTRALLAPSFPAAGGVTGQCRVLGASEADEVGDQTCRGLPVPTGKSSRRRLAPETEGWRA